MQRPSSRSQAESLIAATAEVWPFIATGGSQSVD
jgi:hypothetical protein